MMEIGRLCVKIAGRDARRKCIVVDIIDENIVLIDGDVRRRKCNVKHLEPLDQVLGLSKGASHDVVVSEFKKLDLSVWETKPKDKTERPVKVRKTKKKPVSKKSEPKKPSVKPVEKKE